MMEAYNGHTMVVQPRGESHMQGGEQTTVIIYATVIEEMMPHLHRDETPRTLHSRLHVNPDVLRRSLQ
jgi:hypothetical protein